MAALALTLTACGRPHVGPLPPPPYRSEIEAHYDRTWTALIRALARENLPLRAVARDSGVIASDDTITPAIDTPSVRPRRDRLLLLLPFPWYLAMRPPCCGGSVWESNPPPACLEPDTGFEVREAHRVPRRFRVVIPTAYRAMLTTFAA